LKIGLLSTVNAMAETVNTKPVFREAQIAAIRCRRFKALSQK